jgi:hypothetical protein
MGHPPSRRACDERGKVAVIQLIYGNLFPPHPSSESSGDRSFLAQRAFRVTGNAKILEEWFYVIVEQSLGRPVSEYGCRHVVLPCLANLPV